MIWYNKYVVMGNDNEIMTVGFMEVKGLFEERDRRRADYAISEG